MYNNELDIFPLQHRFSASKIIQIISKGINRDQRFPTTSAYFFKDMTPEQRTRFAKIAEPAAVAVGARFGEMSPVDNAPRYAMAEAIKATLLFKFSYEHKHALLVQDVAISDKFHGSLTRFPGNRLSQTASDLTFAREKNLRHF